MGLEAATKALLDAGEARSMFETGAMHDATL